MMNSWHVAVIFLIIAVAVAIPSWILIVRARSVPGALQHPVYPSGVGGAICIFIVGQVAWFIRALWETCYMIPSIIVAVKDNPAVLMDACVAVLPTVLGLVFGALILWFIVQDRTRGKLAAVIVMLWLMGPGVSLLQSMYFHAELTLFSLVEILGWAIFWTVYFAVAPRAALTYGSVRGTRLINEDPEGRNPLLVNRKK